MKNKATVTRIEKGYSDFKVEFNEIILTISGRNTANLIAKCLDNDIELNLICAVGFYNTKELKDLIK